MTFGEQNSLSQSFKLLDKAFDSGINFFDSAEMYPVPQHAETQGRSEEYFGCWLRERKIPREVQDYQRHYLIINHIGAIRSEHDDFTIRFASAMNHVFISCIHFSLSVLVLSMMTSLSVLFFIAHQKKQMLSLSVQQHEEGLHKSLEN